MKLWPLLFLPSARRDRIATAVRNGADFHYGDHVVWYRESFGLRLALSGDAFCWTAKPRFERRLNERNGGIRPAE
jgi:hypothetical protein